MTSKVSIISEMYTLLGQNGINDLNTGNPRDAYVSAIYDRLYPSLLSTRCWSFALTHQSLAQVTSPLDLADWAYGYQLPTDPKWLRIYRVNPLSNFHIYGDVLYCNASTLSIDYAAQIEEDELPVYFVTLLTYSLASKCALLVTQNTSLVEVWNSEARTAFTLASSIDSQNQPNQSIVDLAYYNAKFTGARRV